MNNSKLPGREDSLASVAALLRAGASVTTAHPWNGQTAAHAAAFLGREELVDLLLRHGAVEDSRLCLQTGDGIGERARERGVKQLCY